MKKRVLLVLTLALCLLLVCGCKGGEQKRYDVLTTPNDLATQQSLIGNPNKILSYIRHVQGKLNKHFRFQIL